MAKELIPILLSSAVWGPQPFKCTILFQSNNLSLVRAIAKGSSKDPNVMQLLRSLWFFVALFNIEVRVEHILGCYNCIADHLSRNNLQSFFYCLHRGHCSQPLFRLPFWNWSPHRTSTGNPPTLRSCSTVLSTGFSPLDLVNIQLRHPSLPSFL